MTFFELTNIDMWLSIGVIYSVFWTLYKAVQYDYEKCYERIRRLEDNEEDLYLQIRSLRSKLKSQSQEKKQ